MLSMKAKYGIKAILLLAESPKKRIQTKKIAAETNIPLKFLEAIMVELKNQGYLDSKRGIMGGHRLARLPKHIYIGDIIRVIDGPLAMVPCASVTAYRPCDDCMDEKNCKIKRVMMDTRTAMSSVLDRRTIADMLK